MLAAVLDDAGVILEHNKFGTPGDYQEFLQKLAEVVASFTTKDFQAAGIGIPATSFDRASGHALTFGNLPWRNVAVQADIERIFCCPVVVENDAKLGALSEAMLLKDKFQKVLYIAIGTGIGIGLVQNGKIDTAIGDGGGRLVLIEHHGKHVPWEEVASGKAILKRYGKPAREINDPDSWKVIARHIATGLVELVAITEPEVIVLGGSIGVFFDHYGDFLEHELKKYETPLFKQPVLQAAARPEEAVVYGCYDLAKQTYGKDR